MRLMPIVKHQHALKVLFIVLATLMAYLPAIQGGYIWDDNDYVTENLTLRSLDGLTQIWLSPTATPQYYPMVHTTFWAEYQLWQLNPTGYHLTNVLLHIGAALLLWRLLIVLGVPLAWLATTIFALHPVHVESVAWVTERKNVLSLVFYLSSALFMVRWLGLSADEKPMQRDWRWYAAGMALFCAALLSKSVTCSLPAALMLLIWWRRGRVGANEIMALVPFFVIGLVSGLATVWLEQYHVGAQGFEWDYGWVDRFLIAGRVIWFYAGKLIWPMELMFNYPRWSVDAGIWWQYLYPFTWMLLLAILWIYRRRIGRGPITAALLFCGTLFPALGFIDVYPFRYAFVADHFQYHASIAVIVALVCAASFALPRMPKPMATVLAGIMLVLLVSRTYDQSQAYGNVETLWSHTIARNPDSWLSHNNLGVILRAQGKDADALGHYLEAVRSNPDYTEALNNLGALYADQGDAEQAIAYFRRALSVEPGNVLASCNLGVQLARGGETKKALEQYRRTLQLDPTYARAHNNIGLLYADTGQLKAAIAHYQQALNANPDMATAQFNLGSAMMRQNRWDAAVTHFNKALAISPQYADPHHQLGIVYIKQEKGEPAIQHFEKALAIRPDDMEVRINYGIALTQLGEHDKAIQAFEKVKAQDPGKPEVYYSLGGVYAAMGQVSRAMQHFNRALELKPDYYQARLNAGITMAQSGDIKAAAMHFEKAVDALPEFPAAYRFLAQAQWLSGDKTVARQNYEKLQQLDPAQATALDQAIPGISGRENG